ncbi:MAG: prenyltransferase [Candidatus Aminicenantaceae bacterium]
MIKQKALFFLLRVPFLVVTAGAVFLGTAFAWWETGQFNLGLFLLTLLGACFLHLACNVANDYFDFKIGTDARNRNAVPPFSGGSRMVLDGFVKPREALIVSVFFAVLGSAIGLHLNSLVKGNVILFIGIAALLLVYGYNGLPLRLVNYGIGEIGIFLAWGPLMVFGSYYVQAQGLSSLWPLTVAFPSGILTMLVLLINEFADEEADRSVGRKTWVILFGFKKSMFVYLTLALSCYVIVLIGVLFNGWPLWSLLVLITLPLLFTSYRVGMKNLGNWPRFIPAVKSTILMNFVFLVILSISFVF